MALRRSLLFGMILAGLSVLTTSADEFAPEGPTPYPTRSEDWPGVGVVRVFDWMAQYRRTFWKERRAKQGSVVFAGDSLTQGWHTIAEDLRGLPVANRGIGGDVSRGLLFRFEEDVLALHPRAIVLLIGTNDLTARQPAADTIANIRSMLMLRLARTPAAPVLICTVPPSANPDAPVDARQLRLLNRALHELAREQPAVFLVDLFQATADMRGSPVRPFFAADLLHLSADGYQKWKEALIPVLQVAGVR